jgi:hypothetical protein
MVEVVSKCQWRFQAVVTMVEGGSE